MFNLIRLDENLWINPQEIDYINNDLNNLECVSISFKSGCFVSLSKNQTQIFKELLISLTPDIRNEEHKQGIINLIQKYSNKFIDKVNK